MDIKTVVINNIKKTIKEKGLKQYVVAERCGYTNNQFSDLLNFRRSITVDDINKTCIGLKMTPNELFDYEESEQADKVTV